VIVASTKGHHVGVEPQRARIPEGADCRLAAFTDRGLVLESAGKTRTVPFRFADRLTVCQPRELMLASGDRLQLKATPARALVGVLPMETGHGGRR